MVADTSALAAILLQEPDASVYSLAIERAATRLISAATLLESAIVIEARRGEAGGRDLDALLAASGFDVVAVTPEQAQLAREAWRRFGKGRHPAGLNYGDCFAYALSRVAGEPLLFKRVDFSRTDVVAAV